MGFFRSMILRITGRPTEDLNQVSIVSTLPSNDSIWTATTESAKKLSEISKDLELPFAPLTEPFPLEEREQWWAEKELERSGLSQSDFPRRCRQIGRHSGESRDPDKFGTEYHTVGADSGFPPSRE